MVRGFTIDGVDISFMLHDLLKHVTGDALHMLHKLF